MNKCPKCGSTEFRQDWTGQDRQGNDLYGIYCEKCDECIKEQDNAFQCLHFYVETDLIGRRWCCDCGEYLEER